MGIAVLKSSTNYQSSMMVDKLKADDFVQLALNYYSGTAEPITEYFWAKVVFVGPDEIDCIIFNDLLIATMPGGEIYAFEQPIIVEPHNVFMAIQFKDEAVS